MRAPKVENKLHLYFFAFFLSAVVNLRFIFFSQMEFLRSGPIFLSWFRDPENFYGSFN